MKIRTIIVDDNLESISTFKQICVDFFPQISILAEFNNAKDALIFIKKNSIEWLVLDVNLNSEINGFDLLSLIGLDRNFKVIFYSGASNYYQQAIRAQAFDFLDKPFSITELKNTINRYLSISKTQKTCIDIAEYKKNSSTINDESLIRINTHHQTIYIKPNSITYLIGKGSYTEVHYSDKQMIKTSRNLLYMLNFFKEINLKRISKSLALNLNQIDSIQKTQAQNSVIVFKDSSALEVSNLIINKQMTLLF